MCGHIQGGMAIDNKDFWIQKFKFAFLYKLSVSQTSKSFLKYRVIFFKEKNFKKESLLRAVTFGDDSID